MAARPRTSARPPPSTSLARPRPASRPLRVAGVPHGGRRLRLAAGPVRSGPGHGRDPARAALRGAGGRGQWFCGKPGSGLRRDRGLRVPGSAADVAHGRRFSRRGAEDSSSIADCLGAGGDGWSAGPAQDPGATAAFDAPGSPGAPGADGGPAQGFGTTAAFDVPGSAAAASRGWRSSRRGAEDSGSAAVSPGVSWPGADGGPAQDFGATAAFDVSGTSTASQPDAPRGAFLMAGG
jgi:translation initiation factor IF-2